MRRVSGNDTIGHTVAGYEIRGREHSGVGRWVGADLGLEIPPLGCFVINVVTKRHYADEEIEGTLAITDHPELLLAEPSTLERKEPFVLNDEEITVEILDRKFNGRIIQADFAEALWFEGDV